MRQCSVSAVTFVPVLLLMRGAGIGGALFTTTTPDEFIALEKRVPSLALIWQVQLSFLLVASAERFCQLFAAVYVAVPFLYLLLMPVPLYHW